MSIQVSDYVYIAVIGPLSKHGWADGAALRVRRWLGETSGEDSPSITPESDSALKQRQKALAVLKTRSLFPLIETSNQSPSPPKNVSISYGQRTEIIPTNDESASSCLRDPFGCRVGHPSSLLAAVSVTKLMDWMARTYMCCYYLHMK